MYVYGVLSGRFSYKRLVKIWGFRGSVRDGQLWGVVDQSYDGDIQSKRIYVLL